MVCLISGQLWLGLHVFGVSRGVLGAITTPWGPIRKQHLFGSVFQTTVKVFSSLGKIAWMELEDSSFFSPSEYRIRKRTYWDTLRGTHRESPSRIRREDWRRTCTHPAVPTVWDLTAALLQRRVRYLHFIPLWTNYKGKKEIELKWFACWYFIVKILF